MYFDWPRLGRCCFCLPLRRGVLALAYIHLFYSGFMIGLYAYTIHYELVAKLVVIGRSIAIMPAEVCIVFYCLELIFNSFLIYGAHFKLPKYVRAFFYYTIVTCSALFLVQLVIIYNAGELSGIEKGIFTAFGLCLQIYMITLIRSLFQELEASGPHSYENQLQSLTNGQLNVDSTGIYNDTSVIPIEYIDA